MSDNKERLSIELVSQILSLKAEGKNRSEIARIIGRNESTLRYWEATDKIPTGEAASHFDIEGMPKILILDIETAPIMSAVWMLFKANVGLNQIKQDWYVLSWSAKWHHSDEIMYMDKRDTWDDDNDLPLLEEIWKLIDEADLVVTQNGVKFDMKKLNARFVIQGMKPPSHYRNIDTLQIAKTHFGFTSNKLEYMTDKLCKKYKKLKHGKFAGYELWKQCLLGNQHAWEEMEEYNKYDVLSLEELYTILRPWFKKHPNINAYTKEDTTLCSCGSTNLVANGYAYTNLSKFVKFTCEDCGAEVRDRVNLLSPTKRLTLKGNIVA
jgi:DNA polymerase elongation subunit (family B)